MPKNSNNNKTKLMDKLSGKSQVHRRSYFKCVYLYVCVCTYSGVHMEVKSPWA